MKKTTYLSIILLMIWSTCLIAQHQDSWITFNIADGLANNGVTTIIEASDGALWVGTPPGVSRYQEGVWTTITANQGLANDNVYDIIEASDGALWFGTMGGGISRYQQGTWTTFTTAHGLADDCVCTIIETSDGSFWFGMMEGGVSRYQEGEWTTFNIGSPAMGDNRVGAIFEASDGALWFGTAGSGVSRYQEGNWTTFRSSPWELASDYVYAIIESSDGALWFGTGRGVSRYQEGVWTTFNTDNTPGLANDNVLAITQTSDGAFWFGTDGGISRYQEGDWTTFTTDNTPGLANDNVYAIIEASDGALWFGTLEGGVCRYQAGAWTTFTTDNAPGLADNSVYAIIEASDGALWFGTWGGYVSRYQEGEWNTFNIDPQGLADDDVSTIIRASDGALWFGTEGSGVSRYQEGEWTSFRFAPQGLADDYIWTIIEASDGALWFGTGGGVSRYQKGEWTTFTTDNAPGLANDNVLAITQASDGALWFATSGGGVSRYQEGEWTSLTTDQVLIDNHVVAIVEASDGALWFGTWGGGVIRYQEGKWTTLPYDPQGLANDYICTIIKASDGALWLGTLGGGASRYHEGKWITLTTTQGLADNDVRAIIESSDGALWFGTDWRGVSRFKPDKVPPFTNITQLLRDNQIIGTPTPMFNFYGYDYLTPQNRLSFSWYVIDSVKVLIDGDSLDFSSGTAAQPDIPINGKYIFHVKAKDEWDNIDPTPATRTFTVDITQPTVTINSPIADGVVAGKTTIVGSAFDSSPIQDFKEFRLQYAFGIERESLKESDWKSDRFSEMKSTQEIRNDTLAIWDTESLHNGSYWLQLSAWDTLGHKSHDYVQVQVVKASAMLDARQGGNLGTKLDQIKIYIPPNAISKDKQISVKDFPLQDIIPIYNQQITFVNLCFEIIAEDIQLLKKPGTMLLIYPDSLINGITEEKLAIYFSPTGKEDWLRLGGTANVEENKIITTFKQLGVFALYEDLTEGGKAGILNVNSQPRIFSPRRSGYDDKTAISFDLGKESNVTIKIYNPAGRLIQVLKENKQMSHGNNVVYWDGKDQQGDFCVSGLYIVTIQAEEKMATKTVVVLNK